jgi:hypothetical protein
MAQQIIGWVQQVNDSQFMAIRSAAYGGATSFHPTFGLAKTSSTGLPFFFSIILYPPVRYLRTPSVVANMLNSSSWDFQHLSNLAISQAIIFMQIANMADHTVRQRSLVVALSNTVSSLIDWYKLLPH